MRALLLGLLLFLSSPGLLLCQGSEQDIRSRLVGKPLFLRGLWQGDKLTFTADGVLSKAASTTSPMLSAVNIEKVQLKPDKLVLTGEREAILYVDRKPRRKELSNLRIEVAGPSNSGYDAALTRIFADSYIDLAPAAPDFWQSYLLYGEAGLGSETTTEKVSKVGGSVRPPSVIYTPQLQFTNEARDMRVKGDCLIYLHVEADASVTHLRVVRPLGVGLDEEAIKAVRQYKFKPALENGQPLAVEINVYVSFQLF